MELVSSGASEMESTDTALREVLDMYKESMETDLEYFIPLSAAISFEDLHNELDIERYYRKISSLKTSGSNIGKQSRGKKNSKHVQTDPDIAKVPASWLLEGGKLIEGLYEGLGNIINAMYHNPESYITENARKESALDPKSMKYFKYDNGYWQSTKNHVLVSSSLLPSIKIPDGRETNRPNQPLIYEDIKRKLHCLFDVAKKLRNIVPHVTNVEQEQNTQKVEYNVQYSSKKKLSGDFKRNRLPALSVGPSDPADCNISSDFLETGSNSRESSHRCSECCDIEKTVNKRLKKGNSQETVIEGKAVEDDKYLFDQIPGVQVSKYMLKQEARSSACDRNSEPGVSNSLKSREMDANAANSKRSGLCIVGKSVPGIGTASNIVTASCSNDFKFTNKSKEVQNDCKAIQRRQKHLFYGQENHPKNKAHHSGSQIDFIKRNILAAKNKANHYGSSASSNERYNSVTRKASQNVIPRLASQNPTEKIKGSLR